MIRMAPLAVEWIEGGSNAHTCMGAALLLLLIFFVHLAIAKWIVTKRMRERAVVAKQAEMETRRMMRKEPSPPPASGESPGSEKGTGRE